MKKIISLGLLALVFLLPAAGCDSDGEQLKEAAAKARAAEQSALAEALAAGKALAAAQEVHFRPTPLQAARLDAGPAVNSLGTPNGYFTNPEGVSGYFQNYDRPFNFIWTGGTAERRTFDGRILSLMDGPGELVLMYAGDDRLLQRYKGEFKDGLWEGHGEYWIRNSGAGGHNYLFYVGEFKHDRMDGRGVLIDYDFSGRDGPPVQYEGEMSGNNFHGLGLTTNLATGRMIYKGLWFNDRPFPGDREQWERAEAAAELNDLERQYADVLMTDDLVIGGFINPQPGQGALIIFPPEGAENVRVTDGFGQGRPVVQLVHPVRKSEDQEAVYVPGISLDIPRHDYPLTLTLSYDRAGQSQLLRLTVLRPFGLELRPAGSSPAEQADGDLEREMESPAAEELKL